MPMRAHRTEHDWGAASNSPCDYVLDARVAWPTVRELTPRSASYGWMAPAEVPGSTSSPVTDVNWGPQHGPPEAKTPGYNCT